MEIELLRDIPVHRKCDECLQMVRVVNEIVL